MDNYAGGSGSVIFTSITGNLVQDSIILNNTAGTSTVNNKMFWYSGDLKSTIFTLNNNWWGNNVTNYKVKPAVFTNYVTFNQWLYMESTSNATDLFANETVWVKFSLSKWYNSGTGKTGSYSSMASLPSVTFYITPYLGNSTRKAQLINGIINVYFTAGNETGDARITASFNVANHTHKFRIIPWDSFSALQKLINENKNGSLSLNHSFHYYPEYDAHLIDGVKVNKTISIIGLNTTIDGKHLARIFEVSGVDVVIRNITFVNGFVNTTNSNGHGGAILWSANGGQLIDSTFVNNTASVHGGAIRWNGNNGKISNSVFENNTVNGYGGAITWHGTGGTIESSNFTNNTAVYGGAICIDAASASNTITNSLFTDNNATEGGAIYNNYAGSKIIDSTFIKNNGGKGGAIFLNRAAELSRLVLINNTADYGGALYVNAANVVFSSSVIMKNSANFGGAIYVSNSGTNFVMKDSVLYQNVGYNGYVVDGPTDSTAILGTVNYNWWGSNETNLKVRPEVSSRFNLGNWLYLTVASNESVIEVNQSEKITVTLTKLANTGGDIGTTYVLPIVNFTVTAVNGNISKDSLSMATGTNSLIYTAIKAGHNSITGKFYEFVFNFPLPVFAMDSYTALQSIIDNSMDGVINLTRDYRFYDDLDADYIRGVNINKNITIIGNGFAINGMGRAGILNINSDNVTVDNVTFTNGTVYWNGINGVVNGSMFNASTIEVARNTVLNITNNTEISPANDKDNVIVNYGTIHLAGNKFTTAIYNHGTITSPVIAIVLGNKTVEVSPKVMDITAKVYDDNYNMIRDDDYVMYVDNLTYEPKFTIKDYIASNYFVNFGNHTVTSNMTGSSVYVNITYKNALIVGTPKKNITANITVNVTDNGKVTVLVNITPTVVSGNLTLYVANKAYNLEFINGTGNTTIENLPADEYNMVVYYPGNDVFNSYITTTNFTVELLPSEINITFVDYYVGEDVIVAINLTNGTTGLPTVYVDNKLVKYTNISNINLGKLAYGYHTISVFYAGDKYYDSSVNITNFFVDKHNATILINTTDNVYGENVIVNVTVVNASGIVIIKVNGTSYSLDLVNSTAVLRLNTLKAGIYNVTVEYLGDDVFHNGTNISSFKVYKTNATISVNTTDIDKGQYEIITVKVPTDATGSIVLNINGTIYSAGIVNGTAVFYIANLTEGNYTVLANFTGDNKYLPNHTTANFTVSIPIVELGVKVDNIYVGQNATVNITVPDGIKGIISVYVDSVFYQNVTADNTTVLMNITGLKAGNHHVRAVIGDVSGETTFMVSKLNSTVVVVAQDIFVGNKTNITIKSVPNENVTVYIGTKKLTVKLNATGDAIVEVEGLLEGNYTVVAIFEETSDYLSSSNDTNFTVFKVNSTVKVNVSDITTKMAESINITVTDGATGQILLDINGTKYLLTLRNSKVNLELAFLKEGKYNVNVTYLGDYKYKNSTANATFTVTKVNTTLIVVSNDIVHGDVAVINVTTNDDATGVLTIKVNNTSYKVALINGNAILELHNLASGNYSVIVTYPGDDVYANNTNSSKFSVSNKTRTNITIGDVNLTVNVPGTVNVTANFESGLVDVYVDGIKLSPVTIAEFKGIINLPGLTSGNHTLMLVYAGSANYTNATVVSNIYVSKLNSTVNITVEDIYEGNRITVNVNASGNGTATIVIFNSTKVIGTYDVVINNGKGTLLVPYVFNDNGTYAINVTYSGDNIYYGSVNNVTFKVMNVTHANITVGDANLTVNVPATINVTANFESGLVDVYVDGIKLSPVTIADYKGIINLPGLTSGNHTLMLVYAGNYSVSSVTVMKNLTVAKINSTVKIIIENIETGNRITVNVNASGNGSATITLFNSTKDALGTFSFLINNGTGSIIVPYIFNYTGVYDVNITYNGDEVYLPSYNATSFEVEAAVDYDFKVITGTVRVGEVAVVNVTLPGNTNENVILTLPNGTNITVKAVNGFASFNVTGLPYGNYTLNATYVGDNNYQRATKQGKLSILKFDSLMNLTCDIKDFNATGQIIGSTTLDGKVNLTVHLPIDATGNVTVYLNNLLVGENLTVDNGKVVVELKDYFEKGVNTVNVTYTGDDKYYNNTVVNYIFASARNTQLNVTVKETTYIVGSDVVLNITSNAVGNLTVYVNSHEIATILINGNGTYTLRNVTAGNKLVMVVFHPNDNFTGVFNTTNFTVIKKNTTIGIEVTGSSASLPVVVVVTVDNNVTGWVTAYVNATTPQSARGFISNNQVTFTFYGLEVGKHNVTVVYEGDDNYNSGNNSKIFTIDKAIYYPVNVTVKDIYVGDNAYVIVKLPTGAAGLINITLKGKSYTGILDENATVNITIPTSDLLVADKYNIVVAYNGSDSFNATSVVSSFNVFRVSNYDFILNVSDIKYNHWEIINITLPKDVNNTVVKVLINDVEYNVTVIDGKASLRLNNLTVGSKTVKVVFEGNNKYVPLNVSDKFVVLPDDVVLNITVVTGVTNATVYVKATPGINETVRIYVANLNSTVKLTNGLGNVTFTNLAAGNYTAIVIFDANENYTGVTNQTEFELGKQEFNITITVANNVLYVGESNTIMINYTAVRFSDIIVTVNGRSVPLVITNYGDVNVATIQLDNLAEGKYNISVKYVGDEYKHANKSAEFNVYKYVVNASESIIIWNDATVNVTLPANASGIVTVVVNGKSYNMTVVGGKAVIYVPNLTVGTHKLEISYANDTYYGAFNVTKYVVVRPTSDYNITIVVPGNPKVAIDENITVILPNNATGKVAIYLDGKLLVNASLVNGKAIVPVAGSLLTAGNHTVRAVYYGDVNYTVGENTTVFKVTKSDIKVDVSVANVTVVDNVVIVITTNMTNADGSVIINIGGINYTATISNNITSISLNPFAYGNYTVKVYYNGNDRYSAANASAKFNVAKLNTTIITNATENVIQISLDNRTTGIVYVVFEGKNYTAVLYKGNATITLPIVHGRHDLVLVYEGDDKFNANSTPVIVRIHNDGNYTINATIVDPQVDIDNNITVKLPVNATGRVTVYFDGVLLGEGIISNGTVLVLIDGKLLSAGNHTIYVVYPGDDIYASNENTTTITVVKRDVSLDVTVTNVTVADKAIITVTTNMTGADGVVVINVDGVNYTADIKNTTASVTIANLAYGTYNVTIYYNGNNRYNAANATAKLGVAKLNTTIVANAVENVIRVSLDNRTSGIVYVVFEGKNYTAVIYQGNATIVLPVVHGKYDLIVKYDGDDKFNANSTPVIVDIHNEGNYTINATIVDPVVDIDNNITVKLPVNATGNVTVYFDGILIGQGVLNNGTALVPIAGNLLSAGNHTIRVVYFGNSYYAGGENTTVITVNKRDISLDVTVTNVTVADKAVITVTTNMTDADGIVIINVDGVNYTANIKNTTGSVSIASLAYGTYNVTVYYNGNNRYNAANATAKLSISKLNTTIVAVAEGNVVKVTLDNRTSGIVSINFKGNYYTGVIYNGTASVILPLENGTFTVNVVYGGDANFNGNATSVVVEMRHEGEYMINITLVDAVEVVTENGIRVVLPNDATGKVSVYLDGKLLMNATLVNGTVTVPVAAEDMFAGNHTIRVVYSGDGNYIAGENTTVFTVNKKASSIKINVTDIYVGNIETITITAPKDITGIVLLNIGKDKYYVTINNGTGSVNISKLDEGKYTVIAQYSENDIYNASNITAEFSVSKLSNYTIKVASTPVVNNASKVTVTLPNDATGLVTITINGTNFTGVLYKGKAVIDVDGLTQTENPFSVFYEGDSKYVNGTVTGIITKEGSLIQPTIIVSVDDILIGETAVIKVTVDSDATGSVRITVNNKNIVLPVINGVVTYNVTGLISNTYTVNVTYLGDSVYDVGYNSTTFNVLKYNASVDISASEGAVGDIITITIKGNSDQSGNVTVVINGTTYKVVMTNGIAVLNTTFTKYGVYNITASYGGSDRYYAGVNTTLFNVNSTKPSVVVSADNIEVGQIAIITVNVPSDARGIVTIEVDGVEYNVTISSAKATLSVPNLVYGTYTVVAKYLGDDKYESNSNQTTFNVTKIVISPVIESTPIEDNKTTVKVTVPSDATGNITITVGDKNFTAPITGGVANINIDGVGNGTTVLVTYNGNDKYDRFNETAVVYEDGIKLNTTLSIVTSNINVGDNATITVSISSGANGNITLNIAGRTLSGEIKDGIATFTVSDLTAGDYNITAVYEGNNKYLPSNNTAKISVLKYDPIVIINVNDAKVGENVTITVIISPGDATGNVSFEIGGGDYGSEDVIGGKAVRIMSFDSAVEVTVIAHYNGDAKYNNKSAEITFNVTRITITPHIDSTPVVNNKTNITVTVPNDAEGEIIVYTNGGEFRGNIDTGVALIEVNNVKDGDNITIVFNGDYKYDQFKESAVVSDGGIKLNPTVNVKTDKDNYLAGETAVITVDVNDDATGNVTIKINGDVITVENITSGKVIYNYIIPISGKFNVEVIYNGNERYVSKSNTTSFNATKINTPVIIKVDSVTFDTNATVIVSVADDATGEITIVVNNKYYTQNISDGKATFTLPLLNKGSYDVVATYNPLDDKKYLGSTNSTEFEVKGKTITIEATADPIVYGDKAIVIVKVPTTATGTITINVGGDTYMALIENGTAKLNIIDLEPGVNTLTVEYSGDINYDESSTTVNVTVGRKASTIEVSADDINKGETAVINIIVPSDATGTVIVTIAGKNYTGTISSGKVSIDVTGLDSGSYNIYAKYEGDSHYFGSVNDTVSFIVYTDSTIVTSSETRGYGSAYDYEALFTDKAGNPLVNMNVTFAVNGKEYSAITDENGIARLPGGTLGVGNHTIVAVNPVTGEKNYNTTEILPRLIENKDIDMDFADGSVYSVRVVGDDGKPVGAGVEVTMEVNSVTYKVKTDANGYANLAINLNPGTYAISVNYVGFKVSNNIVVKQTLSAKKTQKVKKSSKKNKIKAKVKFTNGKPVVGVKVTMKLKSKTFTAKTNSKGNAKFKLPKKVVKKLKVGKKYKVKFTYLTNTITKKIKVKR